MSTSSIRPGAGLDWDAASSDYARHRGHDRALREVAPERFVVPHTISVHVADLRG